MLLDDAFVGFTPLVYSLDGHLHLLEDKTFGCNVSQAPRHFTGSFPAPAPLCVTVAPITLQL